MTVDHLVLLSGRDPAPHGTGFDTVGTTAGPTILSAHVVKLRPIRVTTLSYRHGPLVAVPVDRFVDRPSDNPSAMSVISAMIRAICAASAHGARDRTSHNPPVVGSGPTRPTKLKQRKGSKPRLAEPLVGRTPHASTNPCHPRVPAPNDRDA